MSLSGETCLDTQPIIGKLFYDHPSEFDLPTMSGKSIQQQWNIATTIYRLMDASAIMIGFWIVIQNNPNLNSRATLVVCLSAIGVYNLVCEFTGMYRNWIGASIRREAFVNIFSWGLSLIVLYMVGHFSQYTTELSRNGLAVWFATSPIIALILRVSYRVGCRYFVSMNWMSQECAIVGINELGVQLATNVLESAELGMKLHGFYDDREPDRTVEIPGQIRKKIGKVDQLIEDAKAGKVQVVYLALPMRAEARMQYILAKLADTTASVYIVPDFFVFDLMHSRWSDVRGIPTVSVFESPIYGVDGVTKRFTDFILASIALVGLAIPMILVAILIKLTSKGPVFFRQKRYGLDGKEIFVWKFRSMKVCENGAKVKQAQKNDSRLTPIGGLLRKSSIDELPQLFNVLNGSMSLVGPRPHASAHNEEYRSQIPGYMLRHKIKPGITGLAQVEGFRGETDTIDKMENRVKCDHQYIREWSFWLDLKIILRTFRTVFSRQNAY